MLLVAVFVGLAGTVAFCAGNLITGALALSAAAALILWWE